MDRYQIMFGEAFDKSNLRHVAQEVIALGQSMMEIADKQGTDASLFDVYWALAGRSNSCATMLRTTARLTEIIADNRLIRDMEGQKFLQSPLPIQMPLTAAVGGGDHDDFPEAAVMFSTKTKPMFNTAAAATPLIGRLGGQSRGSSSENSSSSSSSSSGRPLPPRGPRRRDRTKHRPTQPA